ncbi:hypothetical protein D3877_10230 [Azospirillum cavernae]|uniref:Uncharacterized protein n=1 Tax=Azospirillum cavernae TaxID=2320860 RepID=A0A418W4A8_9PROT|nr:hypothetical protein [Azospirillum cavernae]RJF84846.1 hypothetical protein D3877_10230 [Azospirillum cavernae]
MSARVLPQPDALVEIDIPTNGQAAGHVVTRRVVTIRNHSDGRYTCLLADQSTGDLSAATIAPATDGHWLCVEPPVSVDAAIHVARMVAGGVTSHASVTSQMRLLADAVLFLTGHHRPAGPLSPTRIVGGP